jgi:predicted Zn finger-like uncharacterized protein
MPLTGPIPEGRNFFCPHCGALYSVTRSRLATRDSNFAKCVVCGKIWTGGIQETFLPSSSFIDLTMPNHLRKRPRDPAKLAKLMTDIASG